MCIVYHTFEKKEQLFCEFCIICRNVQFPTFILGEMEILRPTSVVLRKNDLYSARILQKSLYFCGQSRIGVIY